MIKRYRLVLFLAATTAFVVVALAAAVWPLIAGTMPAGVRPVGPLASLTVRNTDGRSGVRVSALEAIKGISGVQSVYYGFATFQVLSHQDRQVDALAMFISDGYFQSLGVAIKGPGLSRFEPWQRNLPRECAIGQSLDEELSGDPDKSLLGEDIDVSGQPCRVVGIVDESFSGMRPPGVMRLWISWPSQIGLGIPDVAPDDFLDMETRPREVGLVLRDDVPLGSVEAAIGVVLRQPGHTIRDHRLLPGDGIEPGPRHRMLKQIRLILLAVGTLLAVILIFAMTYALWHSESIRGTQGVRLALGATAQRLIRKAAMDSAVQAGLSLIAGVVATSVIWRLLLARSDLGAEYLQIPSALTTDSILLATVAVLGLAFFTWLFEVRVWLKPGNSSLVWTLRRFAATSPIETMIGGLIVAATLSSTLLAAWILDDFRRLSEVPRGYGNSDVTTLAFSSPQDPRQWFARTRTGHSVESVNQALAATGGKVQVAMSQSVPFRAGGGSQGIMRSRPETNPVSIRMQSNRVSSNFFELYRIKFLEGTTFTSMKARDIILSESAARNLIGEPPWVGKNVPLEVDEMSGGTRLVVGVVSDVAYDGRNARIPEMFYMPMQSMGDAQVLSFAEPVPVDLPNIASLFQRMGITDPLDPPVRIRDKEADDDRVGRVRALVLLTTCVMAVLLGAIGLAEILLVVANRRLNELALRSALGATLTGLLWSAFRKQVPALVFGLLVGVGVFAGASSHLVARGFDVTPPALSTWFQAISVLLLILLCVLVPSLIKLKRIPVALLLKQD